MIQKKHKPVLIEEVLFFLNPQPGNIYLDATFGSGGHTQAILEKEPDCKVIAMDWDERALEQFGPDLQEKYKDRLTLVWGNFALLYRILKREGIEKVDGILADFGTSQIQIQEKPGLSLFKEASLDMRMSPPHQKETAADIINQASEQKLRDIFFTYGQERWSKQIARAIVEERKKRQFKTTYDLVSVIDRVVPASPGNIHKATRIFQALRIYINKELDNIQSFLPAAYRILSHGGRLVCISFHSLEDRLVKQSFKEQEQAGHARILTSKVVKPTAQEVAANPSSRSACLRAIELL